MYEIKETTVQTGCIVWKAENSAGETKQGVFTPDMGQNMVLAEGGLEALSETLIGVQIKESATLPGGIMSSYGGSP